MISCTNLDEIPYSQIPKSEFFSSEAMLSSYAARPYTLLQRWGREQSMWTMIMQLSNEVAVPKSYNGSWGEVRYSELQKHIIPSSNKLVRMSWLFCFDGIAACNDVIHEVSNSGDINETKQKIIAEMKLLRAYYYYLAVDCWGNVPYAVDKSLSDYPEQKGRDFFFNFLESEIKDNIDYLDDYAANKYGRVTKDMANFLLAKLYMSSKDWTGTEMWADAGKLVKGIMDSGNYALTDNYNDNFKVHNETSTEAIFAIPYSSIFTKEAFYPFAITLNSDLEGIWGIGDTWNGTFMGQPDFMASYETGDTRKEDSWLFGQVYDLNGNKWFYTAPDADGNQVKHNYFVEDINIPESKYSNGLGRTDGARIIKWTYQTDGMLTSYNVSMENDFILFRYSDAVLMYVECLLRQNKVAEASLIPEFMTIRTRAGLLPFTADNLNLNSFFIERAHEMAIEGWERQDLIRFGKYLDAWWCKPAGIENYLLLPIPDQIMAANPKLTQNPGY
jgi:hypothetical protein